MRKENPSLPADETVWALCLRTSPVIRLYYIDPEDFWDYGEPAINDDYTLMDMWEVINQKRIAAGLPPSKYRSWHLTGMLTALHNRERKDRKRRRGMN